MNAIDYVLDVPAVEPVIAYLASTGRSAAVVELARERIADVIARNGSFQASGRTGVIVAR